jgi:hypothetical protein
MACFQEPCPELHAMCAIVAPFATVGHAATISAGEFVQDAEAVLVIVECHPLDETGEEFRGRIGVCNDQPFVGLRS